ncbi:MAG: helix-turn-helix domain-containing protein [Reichenbachiella sp.]|uniref:AraC family transcriptional regulator n=1 Tax=Reichenbachiella sp. TaxID=2184521 RepID=UPI00329999C9
MSLANLFYPQQPTIAYEARKNISYKEVSPHENLKEYIYCYWRLKTSEKLDSPFIYRVVSDGCVDILFEATSLDRIFITGFSKSFLQYDLGIVFDYIGIRFLPGGFPQLFNISAVELIDQFLDLSEFSPKLSAVIGQSWIKQEGLNHYRSVFDQIFLEIITNGASLITPDSRVINAMIEILKSGGGTDIKSLDVGLSERQLRRVFQFYYGVSPKAFCQVVRFQNILRAKPSMGSLKKSKVFYTLGYYDQAHFIKEFKNFYGVTPTQAFGRQ